MPKWLQAIVLGFVASVTEYWVEAPEVLQAQRAAPNPAPDEATLASAATDLVPVAVTGPAVPDFAGMTAREAVAGSSGLGLRTRLAGQGVVVRQEPAAGTPLAASGGEVRLWLGAGAF